MFALARNELLFVPAVLILMVAATGSQVSAQVGETSKVAPGSSEAPTMRLEYAKPIRSTAITLGMAIGEPFGCASDGTTFFPAYSLQPFSASNKDRDGSSAQFSAYGVRSIGEFVDSIHYDPALATGLRRVSPGGAIGVSDSRVVISANAVTADEDANDRANNRKRQLHTFLLFFDRKGSFLYAAPLDLDFPVGALGIFESGNILVVGLPAPKERHRNWVVVDDHGGFVRRLQPGIEGDEDSKTGDPTAFAQAARALTGNPQLVQH